MQLIISCIEDKNFDFRFGSTQISYDEVSMTFSLPYPMGDDWLQRKCFSPDQTPSLIRIHDECIFMVFDKYDNAKNFSDSVLEASKQSDQSFKTMRG